MVRTPPTPGRHSRRRQRPVRAARRRSGPSGAAALLLVSAVVLGGCGDEADTRAETAGLPSLEVELGAREWILDPGASTLDLGSGDPVTLTLRDGRASGAGPCNAYGGAFDLDGAHLSFERIATTRRACEPEVMEAENAFLDALAGVTDAEIDDDDHLVLTGDGDLRLVFRSYDANEALVREWEVLDVATGEALERVTGSGSLLLTVRDDGSLVVTGGCNTIAGEWRLVDGRFTVELPRATLKACPEPGLEEQDGAIRSALERTRRVEATPGGLTLLDEQGAITVHAVPAGSGS